MDARRQIFAEWLGTMRPGRLLDLATGHGKFALLARDLGWDVTAVDARTERMPHADGIRWVHKDVRDFEIDEDYDCISLLGLLYHLELDDQLDLLRRCSARPTIIDTHVALRPEVSQGGYDGRLFEENLDEPTASWGNPTSFWPTAGSLVRMLYDSGYTSVYVRTPSYRPDRTFLLGLSGLSDAPPGLNALEATEVAGSSAMPDAQELERARAEAEHCRAEAERARDEAERARAEAAHCRAEYTRLRSHPAVRALLAVRGAARRAGAAARRLRR